MSTIGDEPAHPTQDFYDERLIGVTPGLSKREYFAAAALQGLLAKESTNLTFAATFAVQAADHLIEELNKD